MIPARRAFPYIRLSVLWHIGIFSLSLIIPATVLTVHFGSEVRALELQSSLTASARLLQRDTRGLDLSIRETLVLSDLVFGSGQTYLVDGARNQIALSKEFIGAIQAFNLLQEQNLEALDSVLSRLDQEHQYVLRLDEVTLNDHLTDFLQDYDELTFVAVDQVEKINLESADLVLQNEIQSLERRSKFEMELALSVLIYLAYVLALVWGHLRVLSDPIQKLSKATVNRAFLGDLPIPEPSGPIEYELLNNAIRQYDAQLRSRLDGERVISSIHQTMQSIDHAAMIPDVLESLFASSLDCRAVRVVNLSSETDYKILANEVSTDLNGELADQLTRATSGARGDTDLIHISSTPGPHTSNPAATVAETDAPNRFNCVLILRPFNRDELAIFFEALTTAVHEDDLLTWIRQVASAINDQLKRLVLEGELQKRVEEKTQELATQTERAERAVEARSRFFSNLSHELRTPFNSILGFLSLLESTLEDPEQKEMVGLVSSSSQDLYRLLDEFLELSQVESGGVKVYFERVRLASFLRGLRGQFGIWTTESNLIFDEDGLPNPDFEVETDTQALIRIFRGLLVYSNSINAGKDIQLEVQAQPSDNGFLEFKINLAGHDKASTLKTFLALNDPYDNSGQVGDGNLSRSLELAASVAYINLLQGEISSDNAGGFCSIKIMLFMATPRHEEIKLLNRITDLARAHSFSIQTFGDPRVLSPTINLIERSGLTINAETSSEKRADHLSIVLVSPDQRSTMIDSMSSALRNEKESPPGNRRVIFLYDRSEAELSQRQDLKVLGILTWPIQQTMRSLFENLRELLPR